MDYSKTGAKISTCGKYRYALWRRWNTERPPILVVGLNPSTANEITDDPTIRRCVRFVAQARGGALYVANLFGFRATNPNELLDARDPVGPFNDRWILRLAEKSHCVIAAWGANEFAVERASVVMELLKDQVVMCLGRTGSGAPKHPLYLRNDTELEPYSWR